MPHSVHHVTSFARDGRANRAFHEAALGLRLVKRTVNYDDPATAHLYYGDPAGAPGTLLTFFVVPAAATGRPGAGEAVETTLRAGGAAAAWRERLAAAGASDLREENRFGEALLGFRGPEGDRYTLAFEDAGAGFGGVRGVMLTSRDAAATGRVLALLGYEETGVENAMTRFAGGGSVIDVVAARDARPGSPGAGSVHHVAFRAPDETAQAALGEALRGLGLAVTEVRDRTYFRSIYFREPGGVLFEIATDGPGFAVDEAPDALGRRLVLPPGLEPRRAAIEAGLPPLE